MLKFITVWTRSFLPPKDNLFNLLDAHLPALHERDILLITSKILAIHQGRCMPLSSRTRKDRLIKKEAEWYMPRKNVPHGYTILTIKQNTLLGSAGIDESNANNHMILWPTRISALLKKIARHLKKKHHIKELGIIATDSHSIPLRFGTVGISIGSYGIEPLHDYRGSKDIFGRTLKSTQGNIADALAAAGVLLMGEGNEQVPCVIIRNASFVSFNTNSRAHTKLLVPLKEDLYFPLFKNFKKGKK